MKSSSNHPVTVQILRAIENDELALPVLPEWAIKAQSVIDDINVSTRQIVSVISVDPGFVAMLFKLANSAAYAGKPKVNDVASAVSRIGFKQLRNLIVSNVIGEICVAKDPLIRKLLVDFWSHSHEVAAISYVLCKSQKHLNPDNAMLAGLTHEIGKLPIYLYVDKFALQVDADMMEIILKKAGARVGELLLQFWGFPSWLVEVPVLHEDLYGKSDDPLSSYSDVVAIANLLQRTTAKSIRWDEFTPVNRLSLNSEVYRTFFERFADDLEKARIVLG